MYDTFEPYKIIKMYDFVYQPKRYEIWMSGKLIKKGNTNSIIKAEVVNFDSRERVRITFIDAVCNVELSQYNIFDEFSTLNDRLILITVPEITNVPHYFFEMRKMTSGATRQMKNFNRNDPFACSLFFENNKLSLVTFTFSNPDRLMEFHS